jgi:hypothetical protein
MAKNAPFVQYRFPYPLVIFFSSEVEKRVKEAMTCQALPQAKSKPSFCSQRLLSEEVP